MNAVVFAAQSFHQLAPALRPLPLCVRVGCDRQRRGAGASYSAQFCSQEHENADRFGTLAAARQDELSGAEEIGGAAHAHSLGFSEADAAELGRGRA